MDHRNGKEINLAKPKTIIKSQNRTLFMQNMTFERPFIMNTNTLSLRITEYNILFKLLKSPKNNQYQILPCHNYTL